MGHLYRLDFPNGKSYIGVSEISAEKRFKGHAASVRGKSASVVHNAWRKHGEPKLVVLAVVQDEDLSETEIRAIKAFNTLVPNGYNMTPGGDFNPSKIREVNDKRAAKQKGRKMKDSVKAALLAANVGRKFTDEHREALSRASKGRPKSEEHKRKISEANKGRSNSKEAVERMRMALKGRKNPAHAERMKGNQNWKLRKKAILNQPKEQ